MQYEWDEKRNLTEYEYDLAGKRTAVIRYLDGRALRHEFTYYDNGELHTETDALGHTTTHAINALDQRIETQFHNGTAIKQRFDAMGARTRSIDQRNIATDYRYDGLGRLWQVQPDVEINNTRAPNTTDANGHSTGWTYDYHGRVLYEWDEKRNLIWNLWLSKTLQLITVCFIIDLYSFCSDRYTYQYSIQW